MHPKANQYVQYAQESVKKNREKQNKQPNDATQYHDAIHTDMKTNEYAPVYEPFLFSAPLSHLSGNNNSILS